MRGIKKIAFITGLVLGPTGPGCALIDQTSFGGVPRAPAPNALAMSLAAIGGAPLLVIRPREGVPYADALRLAIRSAEARDPQTRFMLVSLIPATGDLQTQQAAMHGNETAARQVLEDIRFAGVAPERVMLIARADLHIMRAELRLYRE